VKIRYLEIFDTIMRTHSLTEAARVLNMSQPALSKMLTHAEDQIGVPLFNRRRGRISPTTEALQLFKETEALFDRLHDVQRMASEIRDSRVATVRVAAIQTLGTSVLPRLIREFREAHPRVRFSIQLMPPRQVIESTSKGDVDLGLMLSPIQGADIRKVELGRSELFCAVRREHRLASLERIPLSQLLGETLITGNRNYLFGLHLENLFGAIGAIPEIACQVSTSFVACALVEEGVGIGLVDGFAVDRYFPALVARPLDPTMALDPHLIFSSRQELARPVERFMAHVRERFLRCVGEISPTSQSLDDDGRPAIKGAREHSG